MKVRAKVRATTISVWVVMSNWAQIKQSARDVVHKTFSVPGTYSDSTQSGVPVNVRLQRMSAFVGNEYERRYSPGLFAEINKIILDLSEVTPTRGGVVVIPDYGVTVEIESYIKQGENKVLCEIRVE